jgi:uncharacterized membrane protein YhaH (DUF805 family)
MRKLFSTILLVIAGSFFYMSGLMAFIHGEKTSAKWGVMLAFTVPALLALGAGLSMTRFRDWRTSTGIVLLASSGVMVFVAFTFACLLAGDDFRQMIKPETVAFFSDYATGFAVVAGFAMAGLLLIKSGKRQGDQRVPLNR